MAARTALLVALLLAAGCAAASHPSDCPPEDCLPIVPFVHVPYLRGAVTFESFEARVTVLDAVAQTDLTLTLSNPGLNATQATLAIPLPDGGVLLGFNLTIADRVIEGRVQERAAAQQEYNTAVEQGRDAALLQQSSKRMVQLQVNVGPGEERILRAAYAEVVPLAAGSRVYHLPLSLLTPAPAEVALAVQVADAHGEGDLRTPGQALVFVNDVGYARFAPNGTVANLTVVWEPAGVQRVALAAAASPVAGWTEYLATVCLDAAPLARDVVFVVDTSGSMSGLKIAEARETLAAALHTISFVDRFGLVEFNDVPRAHQEALLPGTQQELDRMAAIVAALQATTSTNLDGGLQEAFRQLEAANETGRLPMVVLLSDGLPTSGVTDHDEILARARAGNTRHAPIIVVPIGLDADYTFLADLALTSGGAYVDLGAPTPTLSDHLSRLADVLARPVLMQPELTITGAEVADIYPAVLPPIYEEECLDLRFRGRATGDLRIQVQGQGASGPFALDATLPLANVSVQPAVRALWGQARIADLLSQERADPDNDALHDLVVAAAIELRQLSPHTAWVLVDTQAQPAPTSPPSSPPTTPPATPASSPAGSNGLVAGDASQGGSPPPAAPKDAEAEEDSKQTPGLGLVALAILLVGTVLRRRRT